MAAIIINNVSLSKGDIISL